MGSSSHLSIFPIQQNEWNIMGEREQEIFFFHVKLKDDDTIYLFFFVFF